MAQNSKRSVLILCTGNSCRSQMAEAIWRHLAGADWTIISAGTRPAGYVHPWAIAALKEAGFPTADLHSKSLEEFRSRHFDYVITVCDAAQQNCPVWPATVRRLNWPISDPAKPIRTDESLAEFIAVRDAIRSRIQNFLRSESLGHKNAAPTDRTLKIPFDDRAARTALWLARRALYEDLHDQVDLTSSAIIPESAVGSANFVSRKSGVVCGLEVCRLIVAEFGNGLLTFESKIADGDTVQRGSVIAAIRGPARSILLLERTCLNFLGRLSGVSTLTAQFVNKVRGTNCVVLDTRKTTPGWRALEKYAVRCGGGVNHRMGLYDGILIKDNHLSLCRQLPGTDQRQIDQVIEKARAWLQANLSAANPQIPIEVEVDSADQLRLAIKANPNIILLDNMTPDAIQQCVEIRNQLAPQILLEASGGVDLDSISEIARTGVDRVSIGALTHSAVNFDIGLDW